MIIICGKLKEYDDAIKYANQIIQKYPKSGTGYYDRACYNALLGNANDAIKDLK